MEIQVVCCFISHIQRLGCQPEKTTLQGAEKSMASRHKEEEEASRRRATKRDFRDLEPPTHL